MSGDIVNRARATIRDVPDFPSPGILFKDITPVFGDVALVREIIAAMALPFPGVSHVLGIESRGFLFGVPIALLLEAAFVPARKPGKLPRVTASESYSLEYRNDSLHVHRDALQPGARVLIVDDVLATGGTVAAAERLVAKLGGEVAGVSVFVELLVLEGREKISSRNCASVVAY